ncbi:MAG: hypothetical protein ACPGVK_05105 [Halocynthiibacter sp.]
MLVEYVGLPGSGKSTLLSATNKQLKALDIPYMSLFRRAPQLSVEKLGASRRKSTTWKLASANATQFVSVDAYLRHLDLVQAVSPHLREVDARYDYFQTLVAHDVLLGSEGEDHIITIDEGLIHRTARLAQNHPKDLIPFSANMLAVGAIIVLDLAPEIALERATARFAQDDKQQDQRQKFGTIQDIKTGYLPFIDGAVQQAKSQGTPVLRVDATQSVDSNAALISGTLARLFHERQSHA